MTQDTDALAKRLKEIHYELAYNVRIQRTDDTWEEYLVRRLGDFGYEIRLRAAPADATAEEEAKNIVTVISALALKCAQPTMTFEELRAAAKQADECVVSALTRAAARAREECCHLVCPHCAEGLPVTLVQGTHHTPRWMHLRTETQGWECDAAAIRSGR